MRSLKSRDIKIFFSQKKINEKTQKHQQNALTTYSLKLILYKLFYAILLIYIFVKKIRRFQLLCVCFFGIFQA